MDFNIPLVFQNYYMITIQLARQRRMLHSLISLLTVRVDILEEGNSWNNSRLSHKRSLHDSKNTTGSFTVSNVRLDLGGISRIAF